MSAQEKRPVPEMQSCSQFVATHTLDEIRDVVLKLNKKKATGSDNLRGACT